MNIVTGKTGEPHVTSADARAFQAGVIGLDSYVLSTGSKFAYTIDSSNQITLSDGDLVINGCHARIPYGSSESLTIETGTVGYNRIDLIVAKYKVESGVESVELKVIKGTPTTGTASAPEYVTGNILENDSTVDMPLYAVTLSGVNLASVTAKFSVIYSLKTLMTTLANEISEREYDIRTVKKLVTDETNARTTSDNNLSSKISSAQSTANSGVSKANAAQSTANSGVSKADDAQTKLNNIKLYANTSYAELMTSLDRINSAGTISSLKDATSFAIRRIAGFFNNVKNM